MFKCLKGYPLWAQSPDWPMDKEGKPCTYLKRITDGELCKFYFLDETISEEIIVEQYY